MKALIEKASQADAASVTFYRDVCNPALDAADAEIAAIPHVTTSSSYEAQGGARRFLCTSSKVDVAMARSWLSLFEQGKLEILAPDVIATCKELVAALDDRDARIADINRKWHVAELCKRSDEMGEITSDAQMAVLKCPVTSLADLLAKIEYAREIGVRLDDIADEIRADVRRLEEIE